MENLLTITVIRRSGLFINIDRKQGSWDFLSNTIPTHEKFLGPKNCNKSYIGSTFPKITDKAVKVRFLTLAHALGKARIAANQDIM
jgi:hypothetical protein